MIPTDAQGRDEFAAEFVLGTLEARDAVRVATAILTDADLARRVVAWEARLAPLAGLAVPEAPPPDLWRRIEAQLDRTAAPAPRRRWANPWRFASFAGAAVAAGLATFILLRPAPAPQFMTVLLTDQAAPAWLVQADGAEIRLASLNTSPPPPDRVLELWALPRGATAPTSLGLIPADGRITVRPTSIRPSPGMLIEITLEPPGGSPIGRPTGPIQFIGRLQPAVGS
jgi:anti-sigma-K factor RskA